MLLSAAEWRRSAPMPMLQFPLVAAAANYYHALPARRFRYTNLPTDALALTLGDCRHGPPWRHDPLALPFPPVATTSLLIAVHAATVLAHCFLAAATTIGLFVTPSARVTPV